MNDYSTLLDPDAPLLDFIEFQNEKMLTTVSTRESEVNALLKSVDMSKACGVNGVGNSLLKLCAEGIASSLSGFFNISLINSSFPTSWKFSNISKNDLNDYRHSQNMFLKKARNTPVSCRKIWIALMMP